MIYDLIVVGGGAAGFFTAINAAIENPDLKIIILEKGKKVLQKVKISGGGRCNVTHACFEPVPLTENYPRGKKELKGPFHQFMTGDMMSWLDERGVALKIESDGRIFPESDNSQTIIDCFLDQCKAYNITVKTSSNVTTIKQVDNCWDVKTKEEIYRTHKLMMATGSSNAVWDMLSKNGFQIEAPVPSLFTFNIKHPLLKDLMGIAFENAAVKIKGIPLKTYGPVLITHWGLSGPAVLKLSAIAAKHLNEQNYNCAIQVNWIDRNHTELVPELLEMKSEFGSSKMSNKRPEGLPKRFWFRLLEMHDLLEVKWAEVSKKNLESLSRWITMSELPLKGKTTFKEEFVTAGGVILDQINFKTMESKHYPGLYFAGEVLNIDAVTGGFNFQSAWTTGWIAAKAIAE